MTDYRFKLEVLHPEFQLLKQHLDPNKKLYKLLESASDEGVDFFCVYMDFIKEQFNVDLPRPQAKVLFYLGISNLGFNKAKEILGVSKAEAYKDWLKSQFKDYPVYMEDYKKLHNVRKQLWSSIASVIPMGAARSITVEPWEFSVVIRIKDKSERRIILHKRKLRNIFNSIAYKEGIKYLTCFITIEEIN